MICKYLPKQHQRHNTIAETISEGRRVWLIESAFTMSVASVILFIFLSDLQIVKVTDKVIN